MASTFDPRVPIRSIPCIKFIAVSNPLESRGYNVIQKSQVVITRDTEYRVYTQLTQTFKEVLREG